MSDYKIGILIFFSIKKDKLFNKNGYFSTIVHWTCVIKSKSLMIKIRV